MNFTVQQPRISIVTVVRNALRTIRTTLESVAGQEFDDFEHVVIDGGSEDGTLEILREFDERITLLSEPDAGIFDAMNKGIGLAQGEIVTFLNADDVFHSPDVLEGVVAVFNEDEALEFVTGAVEIVDEERGSFEATCAFREDLLSQGKQPPHPGTFYKSALFETLGCYDLSYRIAADFEYFCRLLRAGAKTRELAIPLARFACNGASSSFAAHVDCSRILSRYFGRWAATTYLIRNAILWSGGRALRYLRLRKWFWNSAAAKSVASKT